MSNLPPAIVPQEGIYAKWAAVSQVLMLVLIAFGYWYTVIPVYQKSLLDEDIAKKTLELNKATQNLEKLQLALSEEEKKLALVESTINNYRSESAKAKSAASKAMLDSDIRYSLLRSQSLSLFVGEILRECSVDSVKTDDKLIACLESTSKKSNSFLQLDKADGRSVLAKMKKSVEANSEEWNAVSVENEKQVNVLSQKIDDTEKQSALASQSRKRDSAQEAMDAIGADYQDKKKLIQLNSELFKLKYSVHYLHEAVLRKILNISV